MKLNGRLRVNFVQPFTSFSRTIKENILVIQCDALIHTERFIRRIETYGIKESLWLFTASAHFPV